MDRGDRVEEWRQLRDRYTTLTEDELQAIAAEAYDLTDLAKQALQGELQRRGLSIELAGAKADSPPEEEKMAPGDFDPAELDLESVRRVWDIDEARKVMEVLHGAGVPCYLGPENVEKADDYRGSFDKGVELKALRAQLDGIHVLLARAFPPEPSGPEDEQAAIARCPKCHSDEIVFQSLDGQAKDGTTASSQFNWSCDACGYEWKDDGVEQEA